MQTEINFAPHVSQIALQFIVQYMCDVSASNVLLLRARLDLSHNDVKCRFEMLHEI